MSERLSVHADGTPIYDIVSEYSFDQLGKEVLAVCDSKDKRICIVTDTTVADYYLKEVKSELDKVCKGTDVFVFPAGEPSKNLDTVSLLYEFLIENRYDRSDLLLALGGGVVGDLCGYTAATYLRGIDFIQVPTTLLSQVDSSIGGKTGVDFQAFKNMVGAFHMPKLVYINLQTLMTLSNDQFSSGMGEVIKHGLIKDHEYYQWLIENRQKIINRELTVCQQMIRESNMIKRAVVERDPKEKGERALLNFGHTFGHAIEKLKEFELLHGHCVAIGAVSAAYLSYLKGQISETEADQIKQTFISFGLPVNCGGLIDQQIIDATKSDKKMEHGTIKFILLNKVGDAYIDQNISEDEMTKALSYILY